MGWILGGDEGKNGSRVNPTFWIGHCINLVKLLSEMQKRLLLLLLLVFFDLLRVRN